MSKLPSSFLSDYKGKTDGAKVFGVPMEELDRDELLATIGSMQFNRTSIESYLPVGGCKNKCEAASEQLGTSLAQIPYEGLEAVGAIFSEGERKYGRDNWKKGVGDKAYQEERTSHAIRHLMLWANGDRSENHLAKAAWFCLTQIWTETQEKQ